MFCKNRSLWFHFTSVACASLLLQSEGVLMSQSPAGTPTAGTPAPAAAANAPAEAKPKSPDELDSLVAPIALYPDPLLAQVLAASTYPLNVVEANRWLKANSNLK